MLALLSDDAVDVFVTVGNATQRFPRLLSAVATLQHLGGLPGRVVAQIGDADPIQGMECFLRCNKDQFSDLIRRAALVICHAGAGTLIDCFSQAKLPVVIPRMPMYQEIIDEHQLELARTLERAGRIIAVYDVHELGNAVVLAREAMKNRSRVATSKIVEEVRSLLSDFAGSKR